MEDVKPSYENKRILRVRIIQRKRTVHCSGVGNVSMSIEHLRGWRCKRESLEGEIRGGLLSKKTVSYSKSPSLITAFILLVSDLLRV